MNTSTSTTKKNKETAEKALDTAIFTAVITRYFDAETYKK